ncbi:hypothetical protein ATANTOWER_017458 [Ataeniobius toweri]|uniref:Uncharacterized protein n=1 Tax=Ataeniobius toweri TaxID=208326 RepID=A0ABU7A6X7_9TELE|nr:hypothetical protein [Ataeniobius toweri]
MGKAIKLQKEQLPSIRTSRTVDSLQHEKGLTQHNREKQRGLESDGKTRDGGTLKDFYKECVEMSAELNRSPNKHWFKANILERCRLQKRLSSSCPKAQNSDVELSAESDTIPQPDGELEEEDTAGQDAAKEEPVQEQDLQAQVCVQHKFSVENLSFCQKHCWPKITSRGCARHPDFGIM